MRFFWCEKHKETHSEDEDSEECLLVGPFSTREEAERWDDEIQESS